MEFRITKALSSKPSVVSASPASKPDATAVSILGSDLSVTGRELEFLKTQSHFLAFNKFCPYRPHFLLLTKDGFRRQWEALDIDDFKAVHELHTGAKQDYSIFYNCKPEGGCSRVHKHMQAIPVEEFDPWTNLKNGDLPYTCYTQELDSTKSLSPESLLEMYLGLLQKAGSALGHETINPKDAPAHNMYFDRRGMIMIPRKNAGLEEVGVNTCGMLGMLWMAEEKTMQRWIKLSPRRILASAGVPPNS